jgi:hypothetical protein
MTQRVHVEVGEEAGEYGVEEGAVVVSGEQPVLLPPPHDLDHVPAGAAEECLELLYHLAVAAHRPVQALQVAS